MKNLASNRTLSWSRVLSLLILCLILALLSSCAPSAGVFSGGTWQASGLQRQHIRALEVDTHNPQVLYAGDAQDGVFATTDAGLHWTRQSAGLPVPVAVSALSFDATGTRLFAATDQGIFVSSDGAKHWRMAGKVGVALPADRFTTLAFDLSSSNVFYTGSAHHGVFVTTDGGNTWSSASGDLPPDVVINTLVFDTDHHQLWAATNMGIFRSSNSGKTWQPLNNGLPAGVTVFTVRPASMSGGAVDLVFAGTDQGFFRSLNSGETWTRGRETLARTNVYSLLVDFRTPTTLYIGTNAGVFRSDDSGQIWGGVVGGFPRGQSVSALQFGADGYTQLYAAANDVYQYPGSGGGFNFDITRIVTLLMVAAFFYLLYRLTRRNQRERREVLRPEQMIEPPSSQENGHHANASDIKNIPQ